MGFFEALPHSIFLQTALATGLFASLACGVVGSFVVTRRITYIAGSVAHCVLGGIGMARYLQTVHGWTAFDPLYGALIAALGSALLIGWVTLRAKEREDTIIGATWAIGMAVGILFITKTPGYNENLMSYLFGNILLVSRSEVWLIAALDLFILGICGLFYKKLLAICFDEEFARLRGVRVEVYYLLLLCLTALTVVLLTTVVGIILVIALITLPAAIAGIFSRTLFQMMVLGSILCGCFTVGGLAVSYDLDLPPGATIIVLAGSIYLVTILFQSAARSLLLRPLPKSES
ncbi:MAG: metal ABC transporter permease [Candidatus Omnitrophica bacterium]|nr:metal ABC transporter permease [Candidatus Omnitrophota bacterium]